MYYYQCRPTEIYRKNMEFSAKFKGAITFLVIILFFVIVLVLIYQALKRGWCNCVKPRADVEDNEGLIPPPANNDDKRGSKSVKLMIDPEPEPDQLRESRTASREPSPEKQDSSFHTTSHEKIGNSKNEEVNGETFLEMSVREVPEQVTESSFVAVQPKKKKKRINSILRKFRGPRRTSKVRFQENPSEETPLVETSKKGRKKSYNSNNNSDNKNEPTSELELSLKRSESLESFLSATTTKTNSLSNMSLDGIEEFGSELSPSRLQIVVHYIPEEWRLNLGVKQAQCLIITGNDKQTMYWQVHLTLLPFKRHRFKTRYKSSSSPIFDQTFDVRDVAQQALSQMAVRYRVYARTGRTGRKKLAGETEIKLDDLIRQPEHMIKEWRILKRKRLNYGSVDNSPT